jgi:Zn-dependent peptidase ImmA (M78 family)
MPTRVTALVKAELLVWARESARIDIQQAAKKARVSVDDLRAWEAGGRPSIAQLRKLTQVYKRPLAVFFLSRPPESFQALHDFRRLPEGAAVTESPELAYEIRRARSRREIALELYDEAMEEPPRPFDVSATLAEDPELVGARLREYLDVKRHEPASWKTVYDAFNRWRGAIEDAGVLVFQAGEVEVSEMRAFSIAETPLPAIVVNIKDAVLARVFSMLHEASHLMLRDGGLCDLHEDAASGASDVEVFCNRVAGATLVPRDWLLEEDLVRQQTGSKWSDDDLELLGQRYRVSREVMLRRLLILGRTTLDFYRRRRKELREEFEAQQADALQRKLRGTDRGGFVTPDRKVVSAAGALFVRLVLSSYHQEKITANDLSRYLEVRLKHVPNIEQAVFRRGRATRVGA